MEDYLKAIHQIADANDGAAVSTQALADRLRVSTASVTGMIKRLDGLRLVAHEPYHGVRLTPRGEAIALEVLRHHRLLELYLVEHLGMAWDEVHAEADRLEHHISEGLEDRIAAKLGQPRRDPHGDPIPDRDGVDGRRADRAARGPGLRARRRASCASPTAPRSCCSTWPSAGCGRARRSRSWTSTRWPA